MKNYFFGVVVFIGMMAMFALTANAQKVGGYKEIAKDDAGAQAAAAFAVSSQAEKTSRSIELVLVHKAERQIVAGSNYRLCLKVTSQGEDGEADVTHFVQVVVYQNLKREYSLTSWTKSDCDEDDD
ncbi:MAG: hypothetical protein IPI64_00995 [Chloracidobacterium sp.]|nr:hypothetical protein [Chloracidobacterium sp.]